MNVAQRMIDEVELLGKSFRSWEQGEFAEAEQHYSDDVRAMLRAGFALAAPQILGQCEKIWITADMVKVVHHASKSLPVYRWEPSVLPFVNAICVTEIPLIIVPDGRVDGGDVTYSRAEWWSHNVEHCLVVLWNFIPGFHDSPIPTIVNKLKAGHDWASQHVSTEDSFKGADTIPGELSRIMCTLWLLLQQRIAVRRKVRPNRSERRRLEKEGKPEPSDITVIELRRPIVTDGGDSRGNDVDWSHRWIVDGHWRNQFHPSTESHVPTWITPHVKGPEDKPLVVKDRIHKWVR